MNPPKVTDDDYINFIIATPRDVTATEAERVEPESKNAPALRALLLDFCNGSNRMPKHSGGRRQRRLICKAAFWFSMSATLEKPYSERNALVDRHWSGKQKAAVSGINLITLLWTDGKRCVPVDYRVFDKERDGKTKNDHFAEMLLAATGARI